MKLLIDSDVCLDFLTGRKPYFHTAGKLFWAVENTNVDAQVSPDSFSNMYYILSKSYEKSAIIPKLKMLRQLITVATLSEEAIDDALNSEWSDFEDAIQYFCAREANCDAIITRNTKDFIKSELPVFTPFDFLER